MAIYYDGILGFRLQEDARRMQDQLGSLEFLHSSVSSSPRQRDGLWWISLVVKGVGMGVPHDSQQDRERFGPQAGSIVGQLYDHLNTLGGFEFALIGWEIADQFFDPQEDRHLKLGKIRIPEGLANKPGLVLSAELYPFHPAGEDFENFSEGYFWISHRGKPFRLP